MYPIFVATGGKALKKRKQNKENLPQEKNLKKSQHLTNTVKPMIKSAIADPAIQKPNLATNPYPTLKRV
jgi:hypothetical protein